MIYVNYLRTGKHQNKEADLNYHRLHDFKKNIKGIKKTHKSKYRRENKDLQTDIKAVQRDQRISDAIRIIFFFFLNVDFKRIVQIECRTEDSLCWP